MAETGKTFIWSTWAVLGGLLGGAGIALLLQQYALYPFSITMFIVGGLIGAVIGLLLPSAILMIRRPKGAAT